MGSVLCSECYRVHNRIESENTVDEPLTASQYMENLSPQHPLFEKTKKLVESKLMMITTESPTDFFVGQMECFNSSPFWENYKKAALDVLEEEKVFCSQFFTSFEDKYKERSNISYHIKQPRSSYHHKDLIDSELIFIKNHIMADNKILLSLLPALNKCFIYVNEGLWKANSEQPAAFESNKKVCQELILIQIKTIIENLLNLILNCYKCFLDSLLVSRDRRKNSLLPVVDYLIYVIHDMLFDPQYKFYEAAITIFEERSRDHRERLSAFVHDWKNDLQNACRVSSAFQLSGVKEYEASIKTLKGIGEECSPRRKMKIILKIKDKVWSAIVNYNTARGLEKGSSSSFIYNLRESLDTDQLISIFQYIIAASGFYSIQREILFIEAFLDEATLNFSPDSYFYITFKAAVDCFMGGSSRNLLELM